MTTFLAIIHVLLVIGITARILLRDTLAPSTRVAWFMVVAIVPAFGGLLYFLFGEVGAGNKARERDKRFRVIMADHFSDALSPVVADPAALDPRYRGVFAFGCVINGFKTLRGNRAKLMAPGKPAWAEVIKDIDAAQNHVHITSFIWLADETGSKVAQALIRAAGRGVTCRALADAIGSRFFIRSPLWQEMRDAGVAVAVARPIGNPLRTIFKTRLDLRNHRKLVVIDGGIAYIGSHNIADPAFLVKKRFAPWVDILLRVEGPVVAQNQLLFAGDWIAEAGGSIDDFTFPVTPCDDGFCAQAIGDGPTVLTMAIPNLVAGLMHAATARVTITTPYFVPDAVLIEAICAAAHRGVDVQLIFPKYNDSWIVAAASRASYRRLLEAGVTIREFNAGLLHAKTLTVDGKVSFIGSSNLDLRSFNLNEENNLLLYNPALTRQIEARQVDYASLSDPVTLEAVKGWSYGMRIWHNVIETMGPVL